MKDIYIEKTFRSCPKCNRFCSPIEWQCTCGFCFFKRIYPSHEDCVKLPMNATTIDFKEEYIMTTNCERRFAMKWAWHFIKKISHDKKSPYYHTANSITNHYPIPVEIDCIAEKCPEFLGNFDGTIPTKSELEKESNRFPYPEIIGKKDKS